MSETQISKLGNWLDGWADLVDDTGDCAGQVRDHFRGIMSARSMPDVDVDTRNMTTGGLGRI